MSANQHAAHNNHTPLPRLSLRFWLALTVGLGLMFLLDGPVLDLVRPLHHSAFSDLLNHTIRRLGTGNVQAVLLLALILAGAALRVRCLLAAGLWGAVALVVSAAAATILKVLIHRPRPWSQLPEPATWAAGVAAAIHENSLRSFPSGESTATFALAWTLGCLCPPLRWPLVAVAALVAVARVLVGAHHPSDVWAGAMLGIAVGQWAAGLSRRRSAAGPCEPSDGHPCAESGQGSPPCR